MTSQERRYVEYERANGYRGDVPGTLDHWRAYLSDPDHPTEGPTNRRNPTVRMRQRTENIEWGEWQAEGLTT